MSSKDISRPNKAPVRVACVGLGRTGTMSMSLALKKLGFGPVHHMSVIMERAGKDVPFWTNIHRGINPTENLDKALAGCRSVTDYPGCMYPQELYDAYPDAKFILTVRDPEKWKASVMSTLRAVTPVMHRMSWWMPTFWRIAPWLQESVWDDYHKGRFDEDGAQQFVEHSEKCKRIIPADQLLVYQVGKDGWEALCNYLGVPVPEEPFPNANDSAEFRRMIAIFKVMALFVEIGLPTTVAVAVYFIYQKFYM